MNCLLDTHILIWTIMGMPELSEKARKIIVNRRNRLFYSTVSVWEVALKHRLHPQSIPCSGAMFISLCNEADMDCLPLSNAHILALEGLRRKVDAPPHKDPFDQILISQAISENMVFLTHDKLLSYYIDANIEMV